MKLKWLLVGGSLWASAAAFAACTVDSPIAIGTGDPRRNPDKDQAKLVRLTGVVWDQPIETRIIPELAEGKALDLQLFEVQWSPDVSGTARPTGWLGARFFVPGGLDSAGFSFDYFGAFRFSGKTEEESATHRYETTEVSNFHVAGEKEPATTRVKVEVRESAITSLELTVPVYGERQALSGGGSSLPYLGHNQTLCLRSARLVPAPR